MTEIGRYNFLEIARKVDFGLYLKGENDEEILLPNRYVPENCKEGDKLEVFVYLDSEDRIIATTEKPYATINEFAFLKVVAVSSVGVFLDWGLQKDLLIPYREQKSSMKEGQSYLVYVYFDNESKRVVASEKLDKFLDNMPIEYEEGQEVELIIANKTDLGYRAIIEDAHWGILYENEMFRNLKTGERVFGFIKKIRDDEKIDLTLNKIGYQRIDDFSQTLLNYLKEHDGLLNLNDKSPAEAIAKVFAVSKKTFKKAIGSLYKQRLIQINDTGIQITEPGNFKP